MNLNDYNAGVLERLAGAVDAYLSGSIDLDAVQSQLQSAISLLENDGSPAKELIRMAEADIERIQFAMLTEQRAAAVFRLDELLQSLRVGR